MLTAAILSLVVQTKASALPAVLGITFGALPSHRGPCSPAALVHLLAHA